MRLSGLTVPLNQTCHRPSKHPNSAEQGLTQMNEHEISFMLFSPFLYCIRQGRKILADFPGMKFINHRNSVMTYGELRVHHKIKICVFLLIP